MKLSEKGRHQPRPTLPRHAETLAVELSSWDGVIARTHWLLGDERVVDGADFYAGEHELGHLHLDAVAHIPQAPGVAQALIRNRLAQRFPWSDDWVVSRVSSAEAVRHARWLFRLNYDHGRGVATELLLRRIQQRGAQRLTA